MQYNMVERGRAGSHHVHHGQERARERAERKEQHAEVHAEEACSDSATQRTTLQHAAYNIAGCMTERLHGAAWRTA